jgi:hypothetical protein
MIRFEQVSVRYPGGDGPVLTIPTRPGFWVPWVPFAILQRWPFAWWVAFVLDHASRAVVGFAVYKTRPDSADMVACSWGARSGRWGRSRGT